MPRVGTLFRFNRHHAIGFSWYDISLKGNKTIDDDFQIDDTIFLANGTIQKQGRSHAVPAFLQLVLLSQ